MKEIICIANEPWSLSPGRTQQLVTRLREARILYFSPATRFSPFRPDQQGRKVRPNVTEYTLPHLFLQVDERHRRLFRMGQRRLGQFIAAQAERHRLRAPLLWLTSPDQVHLLDYIPYDGLIYDCSEEWDDLPALWEGSLAHAADLVFAASPELVRRLSPCSENIVLLPNGVNYPLFAPDGQHVRRDPIPRTASPLLGWAGTLHPDLDLSPLLYAAQHRPGWTFLLLGAQRNNPLLRPLRRLENVLFHPPCPLTEVPDYLYRCDVLMDFRRTRLVDGDVIPVRLYEYLSTGKPVVSMLWPDQVEPFPDVVYGAHSPEEFLTLCAHALEEVPGMFTQRRLHHGESAAWSIRAQQVSDILTTSGLL